MENKWSPCICGIILGILVIVFAWWKVAWAGIALTVVGALMVICSLIGKCCCKDMFKKGSGQTCCSG